MPNASVQVLRPDAPPEKNPRPVAVLPTHPGDYRLAEAVMYGKQIAIWNIEEIMSAVKEEKKEIDRMKKLDPKGDVAHANVLARRREESRVLAQYERMLGRLVILEQKLVASQMQGRNYVDARRRAFDRIAQEAESERQKKS